MNLSFYDVSVASYLRTLGAVSNVLDKGLTYCRDHGREPAQLVETSLHPDMRPLRFQIVSVVHHSVGAVEGFGNGTFSPPADRRPHDYAALQTLVAEARSTLEGLARRDVDALADNDIVFQAGERRVPFTVRDFLLGFSLPNFYFHATTSYDILRAAGVPLAKLDYLGALPRKA